MSLAHQACTSSRLLQLLEEVLQLLPLDVAVSCGAPTRRNEAVRVKKL